MKFLQLHKIALLGVISLMGVMASCNDESLTLPEEGGETPGNSLTDYIEFRMSLPVMETRGEADFETYDDEVDLKNVWLLFFTADDDLFFKQFEYDDLQYIPVGETEYEPDHSTKVWYVRIPVDDPDFVKTIREKDFKIAVLANWPNTVTLKKGDNLSTLHHQVNDNTYDYLTETTGKMGQNTNWVKQNHDTDKPLSESYATEWIRTNWNPSLDKNKFGDNFDENIKYQLGTYSDLWFLWNFGGSIENNAIPYGTDYPDTYSMPENFKEEWEKRNGKQLREKWIFNMDPITGDIKNKDGDPIGNLEENTDPSTNADRNYLTFKTFTEGDKTAKVIHKDKGDGNFYYGVQLPAISPKENNKYIKDEDEGVFSFVARATGNIYITAENAGTSGTASLKVQVGYTASGKTLEFPVGGPTTVHEKIDITGDEQRLYIYNNGDANNDVKIYQIEYIQDKYLYDTNRIGVTPGPDTQLIPMYGIQQYGALGEVWKEGTTFDLSNFNQMGPSNYDYSDIWLLRSVAKVELLIPEKMKAHHIFLRCLNRYAYVEPLDISTDTWDIWENVGDNDKEADGWENTEWGKLMTRGTFYDNTSAYTGYDDKLKKHYGSWLGTTSDDTHIINPRISRSDFAEFVPAGKDDKGNRRYVLYIGEKFVDDPNDLKNLSKTYPKVCHIEFRTGNDPFTNIDDNNCYRIYFIDGGVDPEFVEKVGYPDFDTSGSVDHTWEKLYEQDTEYLAKHWPIIRNHVYSFTVEAGKEYISAHLKVLPWHKKDVDIWW